MSKQAIKLLLEIVETDEAKTLLYDALEGRFVNFKTAFNTKAFTGGPFYTGSAYYTLTLYFRHAVRGNDLTHFEKAIERFSKRPKMKAVWRYIPQPSPLK